jgi:hypothetical protein
MAANHTKCVECGVPLNENRRRRHAVTCSARCAQERSRLSRQRLVPKRRVKVGDPLEATPRKSPPILGVMIAEAAERAGISRAMAHLLCEQHGLGRMYNDGRLWLTLAELRTLAMRPWKERTEWGARPGLGQHY